MLYMKLFCICRLMYLFELSDVDKTKEFYYSIIVILKTNSKHQLFIQSHKFSCCTFC